MKKLAVVLYVLLILVVLGLLFNQILVEKDLSFSSLSKPLLVMAGIVLSLVKTISGNNKQVVNKKSTYREVYKEFIGSAFSETPKLEKKLYEAVDDYNNDKFPAALKKLEKLRSGCESSADLFAVTFFTALCYDDMGLEDKAIEVYEEALKLRLNGTVASNMGLCYEHKGNVDKAIECYMNSIQIDPTNPTVFNNVAQLCIRHSDYERALPYAAKAVELNEKMPQALNALTICYYMLGNMEAYEHFYRLAVSNGSDGKVLKEYIASLDSRVEAIEA